MADGLEQMRSRVHDRLGTMSHGDKEAPLLYVDREMFEEIKGDARGPSLVDVTLNILSNKMGHVFVEVALDSLDGWTERFLIDASRCLYFFESLADTGVLAISPDEPKLKGEDVFVIQMPRPDRVRDGLDVIRRELSLGNDGSDAVTGI